MALGKYITVDGVQYPNPTENKGTPINTEKINTSEGGKRLISVQRLRQLSITLTFQVSSRWRARILEDCEKLGVTINYAGEEFEGTMRVLSDNLVQNSENADNTNGYWILSVVFTEK